MANEQDITLGFRRIGSGERAVVLVHGWMMTGAVWNRTLGHLDASRATYLVVDLRGTGSSAPSSGPFDLSTLADDVWNTVRAAGLVAPVVVGHSMGGQLAQLVAARHPDEVRGLLLLTSVPASGLPLPDDALALFASAADDPEKRGVVLDLATLALTADERAELLGIASSVSADCIEGMLSAWRRGGAQGELGAIRAPTLVVSSDDPFLPPDFLDETITSQIEGARREHIPGAGHYPLVERPVETAAVIERFLDSLA